MSVTFLRRDPGPAIAVKKTAGNADLPTVVFLCGYRSDMEGSKATFLAESCRRRDQAFVRFDYTGCGASEGAFADGTIGAWTKDALDVIDTTGDAPLILAGSSMGGWIAFLCALARPDRVRGLIGLAAAPDFTQDIQDAMTSEQRATLTRDGWFPLPVGSGGDYHPITQKLLDDGVNHLLLKAPIPLRCPVRLMHGLKDAEVPPQTAERIVGRLESADTKIHYRPDGDHRLSSPEDLALLERLVVELSCGGTP